MRWIQSILVLFYFLSSANAQTINWGSNIETGNETSSHLQNTTTDNGLPGVSVDPYATANELKAKGCEETSSSTVGLNEQQKPGDCYRSPFTLNIGREDSRTNGQRN